MRTLTTLLSIALLALGFWALSQIWSRPNDIPTIPPTPEPHQIEDLSQRVRNGAQRQLPLILQEQEVNTWLNTILAGQQTGWMARFIKFQGVVLDFYDGGAEIIIIRSAFGKEFTTSLWIVIEQQNQTTGQGLTQIKRPGGRLGNLRVPAGFMLLAMPGYTTLAQTFAQELEALKHAISKGQAEVIFSNDVMRLQPKRFRLGTNT